MIVVLAPTQYRKLKDKKERTEAKQRIDSFMERAKDMREHEAAAKVAEQLDIEHHKEQAATREEVRDLFVLPPLAVHCNRALFLAV